MARKASKASKASTLIERMEDLAVRERERLEALRVRTGDAGKKAPEKFTVKRLEALQRKLKAEPGFSCYLADAGQAGLYIQARRGRLRYVVEYRPPAGGTRRRMQLDDVGSITLDRARAIAADLRAEVVGGLDPVAEREDAARQAATVAVAVAGYLEDFRHRAENGAKRGKAGGYAAAKRLLERHVLPRLGRHRLRDVTGDDVRRMHRAMKRTPAEANRTLTALSAVFGWADRAELVEPGCNPTRYVERYAEDGERRALTAPELRALGDAMHAAEAAGTVNPSALLAIRLLALSGFRRADVLGHGMKDRRGKREGLRWGDVDLDAGTIRLHDSKTGAQRRVIGAAAVELLRAAKPAGAAPGDPVCPGTLPGAPLIGIDKPRRRLWEAAGIEGADLHSLRHSFVTVAAHVQNGRFVGFASVLAGHGHGARKSITERYISADLDALRPAADAIAGELAKLIGLGKAGDVLAFPAGGA